VGSNPLDQQVREVLHRRDAGEVGDDEVEAAIDEVTTVVVAEQSRAFIDVVTSGMVRWDGPCSYLARHLDGLELRGPRRWFDTVFYERRVAIAGELRRRTAFTLHDHEIACGVAQKPVKVSFPGPVTFARLAADEHYRDLDRAADAVAEALAEEVGALRSSGATHFQLDEPLLCRHPEDVERVSRTAGRVFAAAGAEATTVLSTFFGDLSGVADRLDRLPGTHLGLDMTVGAGNDDVVRRLPAGRGVVLGVFDCRTSRQEDAVDVAHRLEPLREHLVRRDVWVGPNAGLDLLPRDHAFDKLLHARYLVERLAEEWKWV
jgi:5-methyltetrahydropteroyltriglutamate--homocysteine methyltransferase